MTVLIGLLDAIIDRLADEIENLGAKSKRSPTHIFQKESGRTTNSSGPADRAADADRPFSALLAKIRYTAVSTNRLLSFLGASARLHQPDSDGARNHLISLSTDVTSLIDHSSFLNDNLTFLLDASLGLISVEQKPA